MIIGKKIIVKTLADCKRIATFASYMKKVEMKRMFLLLTLVGTMTAAMAQDSKHSVATNSFFANWDVQLSATTRGGAVALAKWFTPGIALRTKLNFGATNKHDGPQYTGKRDTQVLLDEQVLMNVTNLLMGYQETRLWNAIPYLGAGLNRNATHNDNNLQLTLGLLNTFRLNSKFAAHVEVAYNKWKTNCVATGWKANQHQWTAEVGLTYRLGRANWKKNADVDAINALSQGELDAVNAQLQDALEENERLRQQLENKK